MYLQSMFIGTSLDGFVRAGTLREPEKLQLYLAFGRSTTPIPGKGCAWRRKFGKKCNFTSRSVARPRQSLVRVARGADMWEKMCNFTSRSCVRPRQSLGRVARGAENVQLYLAFSRSTTPNDCNYRCVTPNGRKKMQLYLAFLRSTTPIPGKGCSCPPKCATLSRVQSLDHANPL